jgi:apoptosis-inducing factor 2
MVKTVLVLGAGFAGLPAAHYILKHQATKFELRVVLVSPADDYYWCLASPRAVVPGQMSDEKIFYHIPKLFANYPSSKFEFILGKAERWDPDKSSILIAKNDGSSENIAYHTIIVATGSRAKNNMPWKLVGDSAQTHAALAKLRKNINNARSIVLGGGGPTGVEVAGELGSEYAKVGKKSVTLITSNEMVLESRVMESVRKIALKKLKKMNIRVLTSTKVKSIATDPNGATILSLEKGDGRIELLKTDLYIPTLGLDFNSDFAPDGMRQPDGRLKVTKTMEAPEYKNAFIIGDVADCDPQQVVYAEHQVKHVVKVLETYFVGGTVAEYKLDRSRLGQIISIGREHAAGYLGTWRLWGWLVWYFKARTLGTDYAPACARGERFIILGSI